MDYSFLILVISIFASRFIQLNAFRLLAEEDKAKVFSKNIMQLSQASLIFTVVLILAFYLLIGNHADNATTITSSFFIVLIVQRIIVYLLVRKRMIAAAVPIPYQAKYFLSWLITTIGVALFIVLFMWQLNNGIK